MVSCFYLLALSAIILQIKLIEVQGDIVDQCGANKTAVNQVSAKAGNESMIISNPYENSKCIWQITAPVGYVAVVTISMSPFVDTNCTAENFKIYDGTSSSDKLVKEFCFPRRVFAKEIWFSGISGRLELMQTYAEGPRISLRVVAKKKPTPCNNGIVKKLTASTSVSTFTSPGYPVPSPPGMSCQWLIEAPPGKYVKLTITDVNILVCLDYTFQVYDGEVENPDDLLQHGCSYSNRKASLEKNKPIFSYEQKLLVVFKSKSEYIKSSQSGFKALYIAVDGGKDCGPNNANTNHIPVTGTGKMTSPGFPLGLPTNGFTCVWRAIAPKGQVIKVDLDTVNLRKRGSIRNCESNLDIYTNIGAGVYEIATFWCNIYLFRSIVSDGRRMEIEYVQKQITSSRELPVGFDLGYSTVPFSKTGSCVANAEGTIDIQGDAGTFHSPNYPSSHPKNMKCRWNITVTTGQVIELTTTTYQLHTNCEKQWVRIYDGPSISSPELVKLCKTYTQTFFSSTNRILVEFVTKGDKESSGFYVTYSARMAKPKPYACSNSKWPDRIFATSGKIASQRFPLRYSNNARCWQYIKTPKINYLLNLTFTALDLQPDGDKCDKDYVSVRSGGYNLAKLCGKKKTPISFLSKNSNDIEIQFTTDSTGRYPGYEATFTSVQDLSFGNCTEQGRDNIIPMTSPSGTIFSPRYPNYYPNNMRCTWQIQPPKDKSIHLTFNDVWLKKCAESSIVIRDKETGKMLARLCGYPSTPYTIFSSPGRGLVVEFRSVDSKYSSFSKGFTANYETVSQLPLSMSCGQTKKNQKLKGASGSIASYDYPLKYQNNVECTWVISTSDSYRYKIKFDDMDIEPSPGCTDDYVEVRDGGYSFSESLGKFCGSTKPDSFKSSESSIYVEFKTNGTGRYGGFKLSYEETYNVRTIVLISVFSVIGIIGFIVLVGYCIKVCCIDDSPEAHEFEQVGLKPTGEH